MMRARSGQDPPIELEKESPMATTRRGSARKTARTTRSAKSATKRKAPPPQPARAASVDAPAKLGDMSVEPTSRKGDKNDKSDKKDDKSDKKGRRDKVIRDSFTMPADEYDQIAALKKRCVALGVPMKKSELLRAGIASLQQMSDERLNETISAVSSVKTGRPPGKKDKSKKSDNAAAPRKT